MLSGATCLVSNGNNISSRASPTMKACQILKRDKRPRPVLVCCFARFAAYDVKGWQVATGNGASCPWQQHYFNVKTCWPNFVAPYSTDNRSNLHLWVFQKAEINSKLNSKLYDYPYIDLFVNILLQYLCRHRLKVCVELELWVPQT